MSMHFDTFEHMIFCHISHFENTAYGPHSSITIFGVFLKVDTSLGSISVNLGTLYFQYVHDVNIDFLNIHVQFRHRVSIA